MINACGRTVSVLDPAWDSAPLWCRLLDSHGKPYDAPHLEKVFSTATVTKNRLRIASGEHYAFRKEVRVVLPADTYTITCSYFGIGGQIPGDSGDWWSGFANSNTVALEVRPQK